MAERETDFIDLIFIGPEERASEFAYVRDSQGAPVEQRWIALGKDEFGDHRWALRIPLSEGMEPTGLEKVLSDLHDSEINGGLSWFWDGVWRVTLGDRLNGYKAGATVQLLQQAAQWFINNAVRLYPDSKFAEKYRHLADEEVTAVVPEKPSLSDDAVAEEDAADLAVLDGVELKDRYVEIILAQGPGPEADFIAAADSRGREITYGQWRKRSDGTWVLRIPVSPEKKAEDGAGFV